MTENQRIDALHQKQAQGERAKAATAAWQEAFEAVKKALLEELQATRWYQSRKREELYRQIRSTNTAYAHLHRQAIEGESARKELVNLLNPKNVMRRLRDVR